MSAGPELEPDSPSDLELLHAHLAGDRDAFAALITRHRDRLWGLAMRLMRNPDDAADALQDAYIAAFRGAAGFRAEAQLTTWLHRVVVNACLDRLRAMKRRATDALPDDLDRTTLVGTGSVAAADERLLVAEQRSRVMTAMDQISPDQRAALVLVDMEGYGVDEAAAILGCAPGTVKSRCARGRGRLVPLLADLRRPADDP